MAMAGIFSPPKVVAVEQVPVEHEDAVTELYDKIEAADKRFHMLYDLWELLAEFSEQAKRWSPGAISIGYCDDGPGLVLHFHELNEREPYKDRSQALIKDRPLIKELLEIRRSAPGTAVGLKNYAAARAKLLPFTHDWPWPDELIYLPKGNILLVGTSTPPIETPLNLGDLFK